MAIAMSRPLCKAFLIDAKDSKLALVITLVLPSLLFAFNNLAYVRISVTSYDAVVKGMSGYLAYIIFTGVWNLIVFQSTEMRETGALKQLTYATGSSQTVLFSNVVAQFSVLLTETILFSLLAQLITGVWDARLVAMTVISTVLFGVPTALLCLSVMRLHVRSQSINVVVTIVLVLLFSLNTVDFPDQRAQFLLTFNPVRFLQSGTIAIGGFLNGAMSYSMVFISLPAVTLVFVSIGAVCLRHVDIQPVLQRA